MVNQFNVSGRNGFTDIIGFQEEIGKIHAAIADFELGKRLNIAIIAEPFGGKTTLLDEIERKNPGRVTKIGFSATARNGEEIALPKNSKRILLLDNCHFFYMRKIGGFETLYKFLEMVAVSPEKLFITTWNLHSWNYLNQGLGLGKYFPVQVNVPGLAREELKALILEGYEEGEIQFVGDIESKKKRFVYIMKYPLSLKPVRKEINVPYLKINIPYLQKRFHKEEKQTSVEDLIFDKIYLASKGNPGVALRAWEMGIEYPQIRPEKTGNFSFDIELDYDEAFVLSLILSYQRLKKAEIAEIIGSLQRADEILFRLLNQELILMDRDLYCKLRPEALHSVVSFLKNLRVVW